MLDIGWTPGFTEIFLSAWLRKAYGRRRPAATLNSLQAHIEAANQDLGLVNLPCFIGEAAGLRNIITHGETGTLEAWLVTPRQIRHARRIEVVVDFIVAATRAKLG